MLQDYTLAGARVLTPAGLEDTTIEIEDGRIVRVGADPSPAKRVLCANGWLVAPGIVDLHGDAFERQLMPRPQVRFPFALALADTDRQLAANGITTAFHGVTWSWEGGLRGGASARAIIDAIHARRAEDGVDHRVHLRFENHNVADAERVAQAIDAGLIDFLAFNDHLGDIAAKCERQPSKCLSYAERADTTPEDFMRRVAAARERASEVAATVAALAARARTRGLAMASHDDLSADDRRRYAGLGAEIAEFPRSEAALAAARALGSRIVLGAPNVVRGGSHCGAPGAAEAACAGRCDVLSSDYYYPALLAAPFLLAQRHGLDLAAAWRLVSTGPARAARLADRGEIAAGQRADLLLVDDCMAAVPRIMASLRGGRAVYLAHGRALAG